jgi:hypothetical protein
MTPRPLEPPALHYTVAKAMSESPGSIGDLYHKLAVGRMVNDGKCEDYWRKLGVDEEQIPELLEKAKIEKQLFERDVLKRLYYDSAFLLRLYKALTTPKKKRGKFTFRKWSKKEEIAYRVSLLWSSKAPFPTASEFYASLPTDLNINRRAFQKILQELDVASYFAPGKRGHPSKKVNNRPA